MVHTIGLYLTPVDGGENLAQHGGYIDVQSEVGEGTRLGIYLLDLPAQHITCFNPRAHSKGPGGYRGGGGG